MVKRLIITLSLFFVQTGYGQHVAEQTDSLLKVIRLTENDSVKISTYFDLTTINFYSHPHETVKYCRQLIKLCKQAGDKKFIYSAYVQMFNAQLYYGAVSDTLLQTIQLYEKEVDTYLQKDDFEKVKLYWIYALYYNNLKQPDKELEAYIKALDLVRRKEFNQETEGALLGNIADILIKQKKYGEAAEYLHKSIEIIKDTVGLAESFYNLGIISAQDADKEKTLNNFRKSYDYYEIGGDTKGMALSLIEVGKYYDRLKNYEKSNQIYTQAERLIKTNNIGSLLPLLFLSLAEHNFKRHDFKVAASFGEQSLDEIKKQKNYEDLSNTYSIIHKAYAKLGQYQKAYEIRNEEVIHKDSTSNSELLSKVEALKTEFDVEQKEIENQLLKVETASKQKTIQSRNSTMTALLLGLLLLLSWGLNVFRTNRQKQKQNEQLELIVSERTLELEKANNNLVQANYELKTFNHIASHDIKEPIRNIGSHVGLVYKKLPKELQEQYKNYFETIQKSTSQLYTVIEEFSRYTQLSKNENVGISIVDLNEVFDGLKLALSNIETQKNVRIINDGLININTNASMIYIILKNIIENGLKFNNSQYPTVKLSAKSNKQFVEIIIEDNGIGIEPEYQKTIFEMFKRLNNRENFAGSGIGLAIVKLLMDKLGGRIEIKSVQNIGSTFILTLPI